MKDDCLIYQIFPENFIDDRTRGHIIIIILIFKFPFLVFVVDAKICFRVSGFFFSKKKSSKFLNSDSIRNRRATHFVTMSYLAHYIYFT